MCHLHHLILPNPQLLWHLMLLDKYALHNTLVASLSTFDSLANGFPAQPNILNDINAIIANQY